MILAAARVAPTLERPTLSSDEPFLHILQLAGSVPPLRFGDFLSASKSLPKLLGLLREVLVMKATYSK